MAKKNDDITKGILSSLKIPSEQTSKKEDKKTEEKEKSTRGRKKKTQETSVKFTGKKVVISKLDDVLEKKSKTFYIDTKHIKTLEDISKNTGMSTSELVDIAIQLLNNNLILEGFDK